MIVLPWSSGERKEQITKLTLIKREMYDKRISICWARLVGASR